MAQQAGQAGGTWLGPGAGGPQYGSAPWLSTACTLLYSDHCACTQSSVLCSTYIAWGGRQGDGASNGELKQGKEEPKGAEQ